MRVAFSRHAAGSSALVKAAARAMQHVHKFRLLVAAALAATCIAATAATPPLPPFTARYRLLQNGAAIGTATLVLAPGPANTWTFTTTSKGTAGLAAALGASIHETSTFTWIGDMPQCRSYRYTLDSALKNQRRSVHCNWSSRTITVEDKGSHRFAAKPGTLERHTVPLAIAAGLAAGKSKFTLPVAVLDRVEMQHFEARPKQDIHVPAGTFNATPVARTGDGNDFEAWFAPAKLPVPIKIDQRGKGGFSLELESWSKR